MWFVCLPIACGAFAALLWCGWIVVAAQPRELPLSELAQAASPDAATAREALASIEAQWDDRYAALLIELAEMSHGEAVVAPPDPFSRNAPTDPLDAGGGSGWPAPPGMRLVRSPVRDRLVRLLERTTGQRFGDDFERWYEWVWSRPYQPHTDYALFKGLLYENIDARMRQFFPPGVPSLIRLDEIRWGGIVIDGIPPLHYPKYVTADEADYLRDGHVVFGIAVNGEKRAYPKRILAWHELARDALGGVELTVVYCTLCGTVIPYESTLGGELLRLNTSGLLYRSNKLMFDEGTKSLWSTLEGTPVVGTLVNRGLSLRPHAAVTTTWGEWRRQHPDTTVLSLDTGFERDYAEGAAYRDYFAHDRLMFAVPSADPRLRNKDEVLVMRVPDASGTLVPAAIAADFLQRQPVFHLEVAGRALVVVTTRNGANRVFDAGGHRFVPGGTETVVVDQSGASWQVTEEGLLPSDARAVVRPRVPAQRAFWFGWRAQFPDTILVK
jgi:hypothetical protein